MRLPLPRWPSAVAAVALSMGFATTLGAQTPEARGAEVYAAQKCAVCHSIAGVGNRRGALEGVGTKLTPEEIRAWIVDATGMTAKTNAPRRPVMRDYKLPPDDLTALVAYMVSLKKQ